MSISADGNKIIDVEISLDRKYFGAAIASREIEYEVESRANIPDEADDIRRISSSSFDLEVLKDCTHDPRAYGTSLSKCLFQQEIKEALGEIRAIAMRDNMPVRLRLLIKPEAAELHQLHWEAMKTCPSHATY